MGDFPDFPDFPNKGYEFGPFTYFALIVITMFTIVLISFELHRRKILSYLDNGYYFMEEFVTLRRKRWIPISPDNVDTSVPHYPRIINPSLVQHDIKIFVIDLHDLVFVNYTKNGMVYPDDAYEYAPAVYTCVSFILMLTLMMIAIEFDRRRALAQLEKGYYFVEEYITVRRKRWIPVPPDNVDASNPNYPRVINPALVQQNCCGCSA